MAACDVKHTTQTTAAIYSQSAAACSARRARHDLYKPQLATQTRAIRCNAAAAHAAAHAAGAAPIALYASILHGVHRATVRGMPRRLVSSGAKWSSSRMYARPPRRLCCALRPLWLAPPPLEASVRLLLLLARLPLPLPLPWHYPVRLCCQPSHSFHECMRCSCIHSLHRHLGTCTQALLADSFMHSLAYYTYTAVRLSL